MSGNGRAVRLKSRLSERDMAMLRSLEQLRLMSGEQLRRLHLPDGALVTQARKTRRVLNRLTELGIVVRLDRQVGGIHSGSEGHIYELSGLGYAVLDEGDNGRRHRPTSDIKPAFQDHVLAVGELCVSLHNQERSGAFELLDFAGEPRCWRRYPGIGGQLITLKPDAFIRLGVDKFEINAFIEQDMATESLPTIERKARRYVEYWQTGIEQHRCGVFPAVWWLVPNQKRSVGVLRTLRRLTQEAQTLFTVTLTSEAVDRLGQVPVGGAAL